MAVWSWGSPGQPCSPAPACLALPLHLWKDAPTFLLYRLNRHLQSAETRFMFWGVFNLNERLSSFHPPCRRDGPGCVAALS